MMNQEDDIIYVGKYQPMLENHLTMNCGRWISLAGRPEYDLTDRNVLLEVVYNKWHRKVPQKLLETQELLSDNQFMKAVKCMWVGGHWPYPEDSDHNMFTLFQSFTQSLKDNLLEFERLMETEEAEEIYSALVGFLYRVKTVSVQDVNYGYKRILKTVYQRSVNYIRPALLATEKLDLTPENKVINLIVGLRG